MNFTINPSENDIIAVAGAAGAAIVVALVRYASRKIRESSVGKEIAGWALILLGLATSGTGLGSMIANTYPRPPQDLKPADTEVRMRIYEDQVREVSNYPIPVAAIPPMFLVGVGLCILGGTVAARMYE